MPVGMERETSPRELSNEEKERELLELRMKASEMMTRSETGKECTPELAHIIDNANRLIDGASTANLAYWDIQVLQLSSLAIRNSVYSTTASLNYFDDQVFAENLMRSVKSNSLDDSDEKLVWQSLEPIAEAAFKYAPSITYLLGSLEEGPPTEKKPCRQQKQKKVENEPYRNPKRLERAEKEEIDMEERMKHISAVILRQYKQHKKPIDFFSFVLDPDSYGKTVQNIFHVSHLVREGLFDLQHGNDNKPPSIIPVNPKRQREQNPSRHRPLWHLALPFSMQDWENLRDTLQLEKAMIRS